MEKANFIGLIQGLIPITVRVSNGAMHSMRPNSARFAPPTTPSNLSRRKISAMNSRIIALAFPFPPSPLPSSRYDLFTESGPTQKEIEQQAHRTEEEREQETRHYEQVMDALALRVSDLPASNRQIERQIVYPACQKKMAILKE